MKWLRRLVRPRIVSVAQAPYDEIELTAHMAASPATPLYRSVMQIIDAQERDAMQGAYEEIRVPNATMNTHKVIGFVCAAAAFRGLRDELEDRRKQATAALTRTRPDVQGRD